MPVRRGMLSEPTVCHSPSSPKVPLRVTAKMTANFMDAGARVRMAVESRLLISIVSGPLRTSADASKGGLQNRLRALETRAILSRVLLYVGAVPECFR
jgi:hypothetical protein